MAEGADVVVVGGGIIGCSAALELARRGAQVTLLERAEVAAGASGRNHGVLLRPLEPELVPMAEASRALYEHVVAELGFPLYFDRDPVGFLVVPLDEGEEDAARAEADAAREVGVEVERLDAGALREAEPNLAPEASVGWLLQDGYRTEPAGLTSAHAILAARAGARIRTGVTARRLVERPDGSVWVVTDEGPIDCRAVVVAAGPWSRSLLTGIGVRLPLTGARGWLVHLAPPTPPVRHLVSRAGWHLLPAPEPMAPVRAGDVASSGAFPSPVVGSLLHPNPDGTMLAGASRENSVTPEPEDREVPLRIVREAVRLCPAVADADVLAAWWGIRPMTPDGRPVVGFVREGIVVASGHGSQGVILGGGTAGLVASVVTGARPPFDPAPFLPDRFATADGVPARTMDA
jgi:D-hydroxyproline dehydrogenase subunit beta